MSKAKPIAAMTQMSHWVVVRPAVFWVTREVYPTCPPLARMELRARRLILLHDRRPDLLAIPRPAIGPDRQEGAGVPRDPVVVAVLVRGVRAGSGLIALRR